MSSAEFYFQPIYYLFIYCIVRSLNTSPVAKYLAPVFAVDIIIYCLTFRHRASCILGQAFHNSPENAFYIFNQQIYFII